MKKIIVIILVILAIGALWINDIHNKHYPNLPKYFSKEEEQFFMHHKTVEESQGVIQANWNKEKYQFPREEIKSVKFYNNIPLISQLTSKKLTPNQTRQLIAIINNPENFTWGETTWEEQESTYFFSFFNKDDQEIGRIWICLDHCWITEIKPWIPSTKYGGLSEIGKSKFTELVNEL